MSNEILPAAQEAVVVRPGDTLIFRYGSGIRELSAEDAATLRERAQSYLPDGVRILFVCGIDQILVAKP